MSQADSDNTTIATLPPLAERPYPSDPDAALALIKIGRHLAAVDEKLSVMFSTSGPKFSAAVEELIEELIELRSLDLPDPDLEDGGDDEETGDAESSLGSTQVLNQERWSQGAQTEWDIDRERDDADQEPALGWTTATDQDAGHARLANTDEREGDPAEESGIGDEDGLQEQTGGEPSLGSCNWMLDQSKAWRQHGGPGMAWAVTDGEADADSEDDDSAAVQS